MKTTTIKQLIMTAAVVSLCACKHDVHDFEMHNDSQGYLAAHIIWELPDEQGTQLNNIHVDIDGDGGQATADFPTKEEAAAWLKRLQPGEYDVLVTADMTAADGYRLAGGVSSLVDPASSPDQSWFALDRVTIRPDEITTAELTLQRLLASLSVTVRNVPEDVSLAISVDHVAESVALKERDATGRLGLPGTVAVSVPVPCRADLSATRADAGIVTLTTDWRRLMPTTRSQERSLVEVLGIGIDVEGRQLYCQCDIPRMESGHSYVLDLDYRSLRPYMRFEWYRINDWIEGAVITEEIPWPE